MRLRCSPCLVSHWIRSKQNLAELAARGAPLDRHLGDRRGVEAPRELLFDDGPAADANLVDDDLARHDAEHQLLAPFERHERPLTRIDGRLADLTGWWIGVELLDRASEKEQELVDRRRVGRAGSSDAASGRVQAQADDRRPDLSAGHQKCNRLRVRGLPRPVVLGC